MKNADLKKRILEISHKHHLSHLGSCLTAVDIIADIYDRKLSSNPFVLSSGHAGLALYVVLEKYEGHDAEELFLKHGVHPNRDIEHGIWCSTGSLGQGLPIAVGMALSDKKRTVYCLVSDGETSEGSIWEAVHVIQDQKLENIRIYVNINGYAAYRKTDISRIQKLQGYNKYPWMEFVRTKNDFPFLQGLNAHYRVMTEQEYAQALKLIEGKSDPRKRGWDLESEE